MKGEVSVLLSHGRITSLRSAERMKLRVPFLPQQLLFAAGCALLLGSAADAQDVIILTTGATQQGKVLSVTPSGQLEFQVAGGTNKLGLALTGVREVRMAAPAE